MKPIDKILSRVEAKQAGKSKWLAKCCAHEDKTPSLSIREADDGRVLIHCFAGCDVYDIVSAVGLSLTDLFPESMEPYRSKSMEEALEHEKLILQIIRNDRLSGKTIDPHAMNRAELALHRLRAGGSL